MEKRANKITLVEAQANFAKIGVLYEGFLNFADGEKHEIDSEWRMFDIKDKIEIRQEGVNEIDYPNDMTKMYYWTDKYWL